MIASLMMYARPELEGAHERLWAGIRHALAHRGIEAPLRLSQTAEEFGVWEDPALVLSQTCGMPYRTRLKRQVQIVGTPNYRLDGCPDGYYRSVIVVRADDPRAQISDYATARMAYNMPHSQSGFSALYTHVQPLGFWFTTRLQSGGHLNSARMVAQGKADIASLDAQTWRLIQRYEPWEDKLRVLEYTQSTPSLPYITGQAHDPATVYEAVQEAVEGLNEVDAKALDMHGLIRIDAAEYLAVPNPPASAAL